MFVRRLVQVRKTGTVMDTDGGVCFIDACKLIQEEARNFKYPFLILTGELDKAIDNAVIPSYIKSCEALAPELKEHSHFKGIGHEMHRDIGKEKVFERVLRYLAKRLRVKAGAGYQRPQEFRHGFIGKRKHSFKYRIFRVLVLLFIALRFL